MAVRQKDEAERQARLALSGQLASESREHLGNRPDLALLFAAEAFSTYDTFQTRSTLLSSLLQSPHLDRILSTSENVTALALSPDGTTLAAAACTARKASQDCTESGLQFWDLATGRPSGAPIVALSGMIRGLVYLPDGRSLFVGGATGIIRRWDVAGARFAGEYVLGETPVTSLAVTADGRYLAAGGCRTLTFPGGLCTGGGLALWDLAAGVAVSRTLDGRAPGGQGLVLSPDGQWLVAGDCARVEQDKLKVDRCVQGEVRRWRLPDGALEQHAVTASTSAIMSVAFAPDGKTVFAGEAKGAIHPLDAATLQAAAAPFQAQGVSLSGLLVSPQLGGLLIADSGSQAPQVRRLDASLSAETGLAARPRAESTSTYSLALSPDGRILATSTCPGGAGPAYPCPAASEIQLWDLVLGQPAEQRLLFDPAERVEVALPAGPLGPVALTQSGGKLRRFDMLTGKPVGEVLFGGDEALLAVRLSPDGRRAATIDCVRRDPAYKSPSCLETEIRTWDAATWQPLALLRLGRLVDRRLGWTRPLPPALRVFGAGLGLAGWLLGLWTNYVQFTEGRGTPVPVMATQELLVRPPYAYCRNPMALGTILAYVGLALAAGSRGAAALLAYIKVVEEREMVARFGDAYLAYRRRVPFIVPRVRR